MRKDNDFSLSTHSLRTMVSVRKEVLYALVKKYVYLRKVILYAIFKETFRMRKFKISCCERENLEIKSRCNPIDEVPYYGLS